MKERLDVLLVKQGFAQSREKAKAIIMSGNVFVDGQREDKAGATFDEEKVEITVKGNVNVSTEEIISLSGIDYETNIFLIDEAVARESIEKNFFIIVDDIKAFGTYNAQVKLHPKVTADFKVQVTEL